MKQCFCDCCGTQEHEKSLVSVIVNKHEVDLCRKCFLRLKHMQDDAIDKVDVEFMKSMKHQPLGFKYNCE